MMRTLLCLSSTWTVRSALKLQLLLRNFPPLPLTNEHSFIDRGNSRESDAARQVMSQQPLARSLLQAEYAFLFFFFSPQPIQAVQFARARHLQPFRVRECGHSAKIKANSEDTLQLNRNTSPILHTQSWLACDWVEWSREHHIFTNQSLVSIQLHPICQSSCPL
jgi:hypothetical protein